MTSHPPAKTRDLSSLGKTSPDTFFGPEKLGQTAVPKTRHFQISQPVFY